MKKIYIGMLIVLAAVGLGAQTGLFGISFGATLNEADSLLSLNGFVAEDVDGFAVKYYSDYNQLVEAVLLFVQPETEWVAGWFVMYKADNTKAQDDYVIQRLHEMHGVGVRYDEESGQMTWPLSNTRSVHAQYVEQDKLAVLYYDSDFKDLFSFPAPREAD